MTIRLRLRTDGSLLRLKVDGSALLLRVGVILFDGIPIDRVTTVTKTMDAESISEATMYASGVVGSMTADPA